MRILPPRRLYLQNNGSIYNLIYMYSHGNWMIMPYYQYSNVPKDANLFIVPGGHTRTAALCLPTIISNTGFRWPSARNTSNLAGALPLAMPTCWVLGRAPARFSFTVTPTYQKDGFFLRGDLSVVHVTNFDSTSDFAFGIDGSKTDQVRGVIEAGVMF